MEESAAYGKPLHSDSRQGSQLNPDETQVSIRAHRVHADRALLAEQLEERATIRSDAGVDWRGTSEHRCLLKTRSPG